ncbi:MAG: hypothetical protein N3I35_08270 [Clostridia bacterium]|nr:hypothetical protein [Clostridia bacterium]
MAEINFDIKDILEIIFKNTMKSTRIFADTYLCKDISILYKWKSKKLKPSKDDLTKIVEFTTQETNESQRKIIRDKIEILLKNSLLKEDIKNAAINNENLGEFLSEVLTISVLLNDNKDEFVQKEIIETEKGNELTERFVEKDNAELNTSIDKNVVPRNSKSHFFLHNYKYLCLISLFFIVLTIGSFAYSGTRPPLLTTADFSIVYDGSNVTDQTLHNQVNNLPYSITCTASSANAREYDWYVKSPDQTEYIWFANTKAVTRQINQYGTVFIKLVVDGDFSNNKVHTITNTEPAPVKTDFIVKYNDNNFTDGKITASLFRLPYTITCKNSSPDAKKYDWYIKVPGESQYVWFANTKDATANIWRYGTTYFKLIINSMDSNTSIHTVTANSPAPTQTNFCIEYCDSDITDGVISKPVPKLPYTVSCKNSSKNARKHDWYIKTQNDSDYIWFADTKDTTLEIWRFGITYIKLIVNAGDADSNTCIHTVNAPAPAVIPPELSSTVITNPGDGAIIHNEGVTVRWDSVLKAEYYKFALRDLTTDEKLISQDFISGTSYIVPSSFLKKGHSYRIAIGAFASKHTESWTESHFSIK